MAWLDGAAIFVARRPRVSRVIFVPSARVRLVVVQPSALVTAVGVDCPIAFCEAAGSEFEGPATDELCAAIKAPRVCDDSGEEQLPEEQAVVVLSGVAMLPMGSNALAVVGLVAPDWARSDCRASHMDEVAPRANNMCLNSQFRPCHAADELVPPI